MTEPLGDEAKGGTKDEAIDETAAAIGYLLRLLSQRDYTRRELQDRMTRRKVPEDAQHAALARLDELELLDDQRVAEAHVRGRAHRKGRLALRRDLRNRGVDETLVDAVLDPLDEAQQAQTARQVLEKEAWRFRAPEVRKNRAKAAAFLNRRGFTSDVVRTTVEDAFPWTDDLEDDLEDGRGEG